MSCAVTLQGSLIVDGDCGCAGAGGGVTMKSQALSLACSKAYRAITSTDCPSSVNAPGAFVPLPGVGMANVQLLSVKASLPVTVRLDAEPARVVGVGGTFPTGFAGGETLGVTVDGTALAVVFASGDQTAQQVANRINATAALAGLTYAPASVDAGQVAIAGKLTGAEGTVVVTSANATIGIATQTQTGSGSDITGGTLLLDLDPPATNVLVRGSARVEVLAAGYDD